MKIKSHSESHIVELDDGSRWEIFLGDLDLTLNWKPETASWPMQSGRVRPHGRLGFGILPVPPHFLHGPG